MTHNYFDEPAHRGWQSHYFQGGFGGQYLGFTRAWRDKYLPADGTHMGLLYDLLDAGTGLTYCRLPIYAAYAHEHYGNQGNGVLDEDWNFVSVESLMSYWYGSHHCPCHRKQDAKEAGIETDEECEGNRFRIAAVYAPQQPGLILLSETRDQEELEDMLRMSLPA